MLQGFQWKHGNELVVWISKNFQYRYIYRYFQYFFIIFTKSVFYIKLLQCFLIIFPKLIQHLLLNFSINFLNVFTRFHKNEKCSKYFHVICPKFLKNFLQLSNISFKFWANNSKFVLQNSPDIRIFPKIFKMFLKLLFYDFSWFFQNFLKIISRFSDNFSQIFPKIDAKLSQNFLLECLKICTKYSPLFFKIFWYVSIF